VTDHVTLRRGAYHDSVTLMRITQAATAAVGVTVAQVAMATALNIELTTDLGFEVPADAGPNDLLVAVRADDETGIAAGIAAVDAALAASGRPSSTGGGGFGAPIAPRTVRSAARAAPDAAVVLLSVPGPSVIGEAMDALGAGRHVMIFSDNVPLEHELALKQTAAQRGLLVMGPDCGTAIVSGVGLGFANVLGAADEGPRVGIIAASGTGAQQVSCLLDEADVSISHLLGVGGRDLSETIGGASAMQALRMLDADPTTDHIVIVSKPPHPSAERAVLAAAAAGATPVTTVLIGAGRPDLTAGVEAVLAAIGVEPPWWPSWSAGRAKPDAHHGALRGLYAGGTLADEAMVVAGRTLGDIRSNIPLRPDLALTSGGGGVPDLSGAGHVVVDLGDDAFTLGRPHPMIDPTVRLELLAQQAADPDVRVILLDVVLGHGAEPDPSARLAPAIRGALDAAGRPLTVVVSLCGTAFDPQDREAQSASFVRAGAAVFYSNAAAAAAAAAVAAGIEPAGGRG